MHQERADAFFAWLHQAKTDLIDNPLVADGRIELSNALNFALGKNTTQRVFNEIAREETQAILEQKMKIVPATGTISKEGTVTIPKHEHYGG